MGSGTQDWHEQLHNICLFGGWRRFGGTSSGAVSASCAFPLVDAQLPIKLLCWLLGVKWCV